MTLSIFLLVFLWGTPLYFSQNQTSRYFYVQITTDSLLNNIKPAQNVKIFDLCKSKYAERLELGLFKLSNKKLKKISLEIDGKVIPIDLSKESKNKFYEITIYLTNPIAPNSNIKFIKGDLHQLWETSNDNSNLIIVKFPQTVIIDNKAFVRENEIFNKYIFD